MGYEIEMLVGKSSQERDEFAKDKSKPFADGSGFEYLKDDKGSHVLTGRKEKWFQIMATVDLCKLGYQDDPLNKLIAESHRTAKEQIKSKIHFFYGTDGNTQIDEDKYGAAMWPVPVKDVLAAMEQSLTPHDPYRRIVWAIALLKAVADDKQELEVMFYGH